MLHSSPQKVQILTTQRHMSFENHEGKGGNTDNKHFLMFSDKFLFCVAIGLRPIYFVSSKTFPFEQVKNFVVWERVGF